MHKRSAVRLSAVIGTTAIALGIALAVPVAARAATTSYDVDCNDLAGEYDEFFVIPGDTITFNLTDCDTIDQYEGDVTPSPVGGVPASTIELDAGDDIRLADSNTGDEYYATVTEAGAETVPEGTLLFTQDFELDADGDEVILDDNSGGNGDHYFGGIEDCAVGSYDTGAHVYSTLDVTVLVDGTYTFRGMYSDPLGSYVPFEPYDPIEDPFLALYTTFDPDDVDSGVVGCNDDLNDIGAENDAEYLSDGTIIDGHQPFFSADLEAGEYTLVMMTYEEMSLEQLSSGADFPAGTKTDTFQLWGPLGGLALGHDLPVVTDPEPEPEPEIEPAAGPTLPDTGSDQTPSVKVLLGGLLLLSAGATLVLVRRRRKV